MFQKLNYLFRGFETFLDCGAQINQIVKVVQFHPNSNYVATGSSDRSIRIWDNLNGSCVRVLTGHKVVQFHPNSNYVATGSSDRSIRIWDNLNGSCVRVLTGHKPFIYFLCFSPVMANYHDNSDTEESFTELESSGSEGDDSSLDDSSDDDSDTNTDTDTVMDETQWRRIADSTAPPPPRFPFTGTTGLNIPGNIESMSPLDFFHVFFDDELIELICTETNRFAEQCNADPNTWHPVTPPELRVFLALNTLKGNCEEA
ncbi:uncharacterized protein LOC135197472 [Macrobrachium nipponense]|uniref:uncharacterized protein LOC135197472 n=1 Tax=Macrobrachium nipponense TaxID=159736 RepID=UPI0030C7CEFC